MFGTLIKLAIISSKILRIYDELTERYVRPTLNLFIKKPFGFGFSTFAKDLVEKGYANYINEFSAPGIIGTVRQGKLYVGSLAYSGYKLTIFDEVMNLETKAKKLILELSEQMTASRDIQGFVEKEFDKELNGVKYHIKEGKIEVYVHSSYVFGTASDRILQDNDLSMLLSRCFVLHLSMDKEEALLLKKGIRRLEINPTGIPENVVPKVVIPKDENMRLIQLIEEQPSIVDENVGGYFTRVHDDLIRIASVHKVAKTVTKGSQEEIQEGLVIDRNDIKFAVKFYPLHQIGFMLGSLRIRELEALKYLNGLTAKELAKKLKVNEVTAYRILNNLVERGLVVKVGHRYFINVNLDI